MKIKLFALLFFVPFILPAQRHCMTYEYDQYLKSNDPSYASNRKKIESGSLDKLTAHKIFAGTVNIPVVIHVLYKTPEQNLSDEQIISQIDVLNEDYAGLNASFAQVPQVWKSIAAKTGIRFQLAKRDASGNPATGIIRIATTLNSFSDDKIKFDSTGGSSAWNTKHFLNIWIGGLANNVLGYAQMPGGDAETDGVVVDYRAFGRTGDLLAPQYNLGRTVTHEVGHWLNLFHTWGDSNCGNDFISDTPVQQTFSKGCPAFPHITCNNGPDGDMFQNYMDYTDDRCMMLFTNKQMERMITTIINDRDSLVFSNDFLNAAKLNNDLKISINSPAGLICDKNITPVIGIENTGLSEVNNFVLQYRTDDNEWMNEQWNGSLLPGFTVQITLPKMLIKEDLHIFEASVSEINTGDDDYIQDNYKTSGFLNTPEQNGCPVFPETPGITISPNPAKDVIFIQSFYKEAQKATLSIYNTLGKKIYSKDYFDSHESVLKIDVSGIASGIYFLEVKTFNKSASEKFIVN